MSSVVIKARRPGEPGLIEEARELWRYRFLIRALAERELRIRYKNSVLGIFWSMLGPLFQVLVMTIAVGYILNSGPSNLSSYMLCAFLPWTFFQSAVLDASTSVLSQLPLLKKVYFPREIPLLATICANCVHFCMSLLVFFIYRWLITPFIFGAPGPPPREILLLPVIILIQFCLTAGVAFFVCAWNVFYEDVKFLVTMSLQFLFYLLPILYFSENIFYSGRITDPVLRSWAYHLYLINPLAWVVTAYKQIFFQRQAISPRGAPIIMSAPFDYRYMAIAALISFVIFITGYMYFNSRKWKFTERP